MFAQFEYNFCLWVLKYIKYSIQLKIICIALFYA